MLARGEYLIAQYNPMYGNKRDLTLEGVQKQLLPLHHYHKGYFLDFYCVGVIVISAA